MTLEDKDIAELIHMLQSDDGSLRCAAAEALCQQADACGQACVALIRACRTDEGTRDWANAALESMGPPPQDALPELVSLLRDSSSDVKYWAATMIGRLDYAAASAVDVLADVVQSDDDVAVRQRAIWAADRIGVTTPKLQAALKSASDSSNPRLARMAQQSLVD